MEKSNVIPPRQVAICVFAHFDWLQ